MTGAACDSIRSWEGDYQGFFQITRGQLVEKRRVRLHANVLDHRTVVLNTHDEDGRLLYQVSVHDKGRRQIEVDLTSLGISSTILKAKDDGCYESKEHFLIRFCPNGKDFLFDVFRPQGELWMAITGFRVTGTERPLLEKPKVHSFDEVRNRVIKYNFESRVQLEKQHRAKLNARKSILELVPKISIGGLSAIVSHDIPSLISYIGELTPFLLPGKWMKARQNYLLAQAEWDALLLLRSNLMLQLEGLYLSLWQTQQSREVFREGLKLSEEVELFLKKQTENRIVNPSVLENFEIQSLELRAGILTLDQVEQTLLTAISHSIGYQNPSAVLGVEDYPYFVGSDFKLPPGLAHLQQTVLDRSLELRQIRTLIQAAKANEVAAFFSWLDPSILLFDLSLGGTIAITRSQIKELLIQEEELTSRLMGMAKDQEKFLNTEQEALQLRLRKKELLKIKVNRMKEEFFTQPEIDPIYFTLILSEKIQAEVDYVSFQASISATHAKLRRLLFDSGYHCLWENCKPNEMLNWN
jgi:hypothetical protein